MRSERRARRRALSAGLGILAAGHHALLIAAPALPPGTLPVPSSAWVTAGSATSSQAGSTLTINQSSQKAILNWQSFNIAPDSEVAFVQPGRDATALNRIHDLNPSLIQGRLSANGQVYLINANGILFDGGAQVNVGGLIASALNVSDDVFQAGLLSTRLGQAAFSFEGDADAFAASRITVEQGARLAAANGGRVMLLAPTVENRGTIRTPDGQTVLAAGGKVYLAAPQSADLRGFLVEVDAHASGATGTATNAVTGDILAERGDVTLVGLAVNQHGAARATSTVNLNGSVRLLARDTVGIGSVGGFDTNVAGRGGALTLGPGSVTEVLPEADSDATLRDEAPYTPGRVELFGRTVHLQDNAQVRVPGGVVEVSAQVGQQFQANANAREDVRIQLDPGAVIDVAGLEDVEVSVARNVVEAELRGTELRDAPLQRDDFLRGATVFVDARVGTPLADVSGFLGGVERGVAERAATGGTITLRSEGDVVLRAGSGLDVSGGSIAYQDGIIATTKLVTADGRVVDIGQADPNVRYVAFADSYSYTDPKWGVRRSWQLLPGQFEPGYTEGRDAGTINVLATRAVLDGALHAATLAGQFQRELARHARGAQPTLAQAAGALPYGGRLVLGDAGAGGQFPDFLLGEVRFTGAPQALAADFSFGAPDALTALPEPQRSTLELDPARLAASGFTDIGVYANGAVSVAPDAPVTLAPGGALSLTGSQITVGADLNAPAGSLALRSRVTATTVAADPDTLTVEVASGVTLAARGQWSNDALTGPGAGPLAPDAGSIRLTSAADVILGAGSVLDVTGGALLDADGTLTPGEAGSITLVSGENSELSDFEPNPYGVRLGGTLLGHGLGAGGALAITSAQVQIGGVAPGTPGALHLTPEFFTQGGFSRYALTGRDGLTVAAGTVVAPVAETLAPAGGFTTQASGADVRAFTTAQLLPEALREGGELTLATSNPFLGDLLLDTGSVLRVDPGGSVNLSSARQLTVLGTVDAPAGRISLATQPGGGTDDAYFPGQSIWLGAQARLLARGYARIQPDAQGLRVGEVLAGGAIALDARKGYVVVEQGALLDASGTAATVDLAPVGGVGPPQAVTVASDGGSISLAAREGLLLDGTLRAAAGDASALGGVLAVSLNRPPVQNVGFPVGPVRLEVRPQGSAVPVGLLPGTDIPTDLNGRGLLSAQTVTQGGFVDLTLRSDAQTGGDRIQFTDDVDLALPGNVVLDAFGVGVDVGVDARVSGAYVRLGSLASPVGGAPTAGDGRLTLGGEFIELAGDVNLYGVGEFTAESGGDIRARGVLSGGFTQTLAGALRAAGDITLRGAQVYPTTLADYRIEAGGTLRVEGIGGSPAAPPLSAGGTLTLAAGTAVEQAGTLRAPFGRIAFEAPAVNLEDASLTSVSGAGLLVPFGQTELGGRDWSYRLAADNALLIEAPPEKRITLAGAALDLAPGATVDLGGGGDLAAFEFLPGPGGSFNVLDAALTGDSFAVLPQFGAAFAPHDQQATLGGAPQPGELVYLEGVPGLPAGYYARLPASYALLPGGQLVTPASGPLGLDGAGARALAQGGVLVSGRDARLLAGGTVGEAALTRDYLVRSGAELRRLGEYTDTRASAFFAEVPDAQLPRDAGRLSLAATQTLRLESTLRTAPALGGRGAELDITAPRLALLGGGASAPGADFVTLDASTLTGLGISSLLLGGTRAFADGALELTVGTGELVVDTAGAALAGPELILAATDALIVRAGSVLDGSGEGAPGRGLTVGRDGDGDGALIRLSGADDATLTRLNVDRNRGDLLIETGAVLRADGAARLDATREHVLGAGVLDLADGAALALAGGQVSLGAVPGGTGGLVLGSADLAALTGVGSLELRSYSGIDVYGDVALGGADLAALTLDGGGLRGFAGDLALRAQTVTLRNTTGGVVSGGAAGTLMIDVGQLRLADGAFALRGYAQANLTAGDILATGTGTLSADGGLALTTARLAAQGGADYTLETPSALDYTGTPAGTLPTLAGLGGRLALKGASLRLDGRVELPSGVLTAQASGPGGITLGSGALLDLAGRTQRFGSATRASGGGRAVLVADAGNIVTDAGSVLDVSGAPGADGGLIELRAPQGEALLAGTLRGGAAALPGQVAPAQGRFVLDVVTLADFGALNAALEPVFDAGALVSGGFTQERLLRVRTGDVAVGADVVATARRFELAVDAGSLDFAGRVDASGPKGGRVALYAGGDLTLVSSAVLDAHATAPAAAVGTGGRGGEVTLGTRDGTLTLATGAEVNVAAGPGATEAQGGRVLLRAPRVGADVAIGALDATITGAREVVAEAVRVYDGVGTLSASGGALGLDAIATDNDAFMAGADAIRTRLLQDGNAAFHLRPGVEVRSVGDLTVTGDLDLQPLRAGGEPGVLTLRAGGNLVLDGSLSDGFSTATTTGVLQGGPGWSYRLVAGADFAAADPLATVRGAVGDVTVGAGRLVRTGSGRIELAAARDLILAAKTSVIYTAGVPGAALADFTAPTVNGFAAQFPVDGGDLRIAVGRDLIAAPADQLPTTWLYRQGRSNSDGTMAPANRTAWWLRYADFRQGLGALGGGDVDIRAGGNVSNLGVSIPTTGRLPVAVGAQADPNALVLSGGGDLYLEAGGDIGSALFYLGAGNGVARAGGAIGAARSAAGQPLNALAFLGDATLTLEAGGDVALGALANPTVLTQIAGNLGGVDGAQRRAYYLSYGAGSALDVRSLAGSVVLDFNDQPVRNGYAASGLANLDRAALAIAPPSLSATAFGGDVRRGTAQALSLAPAPRGQLELLAAGDVDLGASLTVSDVDPRRSPGGNVASPAQSVGTMGVVTGRSARGALGHSNPPLHTGDRVPVRIAAGGNVAGRSGNLTLVLPKAALIEAGEDVADLWLFGQHLDGADVTRIVAGGSVRYATPRSVTGTIGSASNRLELGGPGRLEVLAGGDVDLGTGGGIVTRGNLNNPFLPDGGAAVLVMAGLRSAPDYAGFGAAYLDPAAALAAPHAQVLIDFVEARTGATGLDAASAWAQFQALPVEQQAVLAHDVFYAELRATGRAAATPGDGFGVYERGFAAIAALFPAGEDGAPPRYDGDINLFFSQIRTEQGGGIDLFAPGGLVNAGLANPGGFSKPATELGIVTARGGSIRGFVDQDFLVNQSRVFTLGGGDILLWASRGNIDAGRGAKTAAATPPPVVRIVGDQVVLDTSRSISGSGIGVLLSGPDVVPGDVDLIAPNGEVNAGDAGIRVAGNLTIAAPRVVGADNIAVGGIASGVPVADTGGLAASLSGVSSVASAATKSAVEGVAQATERAASAQAGGGLAVVRVEVVGYE